MEEVFAETLWVSPDGNDNSPGAADASLGSLVAATQRAFDNQAEGRSTRVILKPGVYREKVKISSHPRNEAVVVIEAEHPGEAIISGSDVFTDWERLGEAWRHPWLFKWGLSIAPNSYGNAYFDFPDLMRRREVVLVDGQLMRQVLSAEEMRPGTFQVDEMTGMIYLMPPEESHLEAAQVEVGVRSVLLHIASGSNLVIRGLVFQHDTSPSYVTKGAVLQLSNCVNTLVEDCGFTLNNNKGLLIDGANSVDITLRRVTCNRNGCLGLVVLRSRNLRIEDSETSLNNWRGTWAGVYRGAPCGMKLMYVRNGTLRRHKALRNLATGIWLDEENYNICIEDCVVYGNYRGVHLEAGGGPAIVQGCTVVANRQEPTHSQERWSFGSGIVITHMPDVLLRHNFCADNDIAQVGVRDDRAFRVLTDKEGGEQRVWRTERLTLEDNTFVATGKHRALVHIADELFDEGRFFKSFRSNCNRYLGRPGGRNFLVGGYRPCRGKKSIATDHAAQPTFLDFEDWRRRTGQDTTSLYNET